MGKSKKKKKSERGNDGKTNTWTTIDVVVGPPQKEDGIKLLRIRQGEETLFVTCTKKLLPFSLHFIEYPDLRSYGPYVLCNAHEGSCILCQVGKPVVKKLITPVFSIEAGDIRFLPISLSGEPFALLPQLGNIFESGGSRHLVSIRRDGNYKFLVSRLEFDESMRLQILPIIKEFMAMLKEGAVDIDSVYPRINNRTLADVPEIERILAAKGINLQKTDAVDDEDV